MADHPHIESAKRALHMVLIQMSTGQIKDTSLQAGVEEALKLIEKTIPDLAGALEIATAALDDASSVVDKSENERYAYEHELTAMRNAAKRLAAGEYEDMTAPTPPSP